MCTLFLLLASFLQHIVSTQLLDALHSQKIEGGVYKGTFVYFRSQAPAHWLDTLVDLDPANITVIYAPREKAQDLISRYKPSVNRQFRYFEIMDESMFDAFFSNCGTLFTEVNENTCERVNARRSKNMWTRTFISDLSMTDCETVPWIFTYNAGSPSYDYMVQTSVISAKAAGNVRPHCIFDGDESSEIAKWLNGQGVNIVYHSPTWSAEMWSAAQKHTRAGSINRSYLQGYNIVRAYQRIDIPLIFFFRQYEFILYTDTDVFFNDRVALSDILRFKGPAVHMAPTSSGTLNDGVMVMNVDNLSRSYRAFLHFILSSNPIDFPGYGSGDQGAYLQFYEQDMRPGPNLPKIFNVNNLNEFYRNAKIVHFKGRRKPLRLLSLLITRKKCPTSCKTPCVYAFKWLSYCIADACKPYHSVCPERNFSGIMSQQMSNALS